jgi:ankyrin repeat protein
MYNQLAVDAQLLEAGNRNDIDAMRAALDAGACANARSGPEARSYTAMHHAATNGSTEAIALFVAAGGALDVRDEFGSMPIESAIQFYRGPDREAFCLWLAKQEVSSLAKSERAVSMAAEENFVELLDFLVAEGCGVDSRDSFDTVPLQAAAHAGALEAVKRILSLGAVVDSRNQHGYTPLHVAVDRGNFEIARCLLAAGANVNTAQVAGYRPLHSVVSTRPLHSVVSIKEEEFVEMLLHAGADLHAKNNNGETALDHAIKRGNVRAMLALEAAGAGGPVDQEQLDLRLAAAAKAGQTDMVRYLLGCGADPTYKPSGKTLLQYAKGGAVEVKQLILAARAGTLIDDALSATGGLAGGSSRNLGISL